MMLRALLAAFTSCAVAAVAVGEPAVIDAPAAFAEQQSGALVLIDVRRPNEWRATGLPAGAVGATLQDADFIDEVLTALDGDRTRPVALICRRGKRSAEAAEILERAGFTDVRNVEEGLVGRRGAGPGWRARGLPITPYGLESRP